MDTKLTPLSYKIHIVPDLAHFTFSGSIEVSLNAQLPVEEIELNILDLAIWYCRVLDQAGFVDCPFKVDPQKELLIIHLPAKRSGDLTVRISYQGYINDKMAGFYRSRYRRRGKEKYMAVTQFEESDARRAFPCLDHPSRKATFKIELDIDPHLTAVSNTPVQSERTLENGKIRVAFARTPRMSTYLVFWGVGEFEFLQDRNDTRVRVAVLPGKKRYAGFALSFGRQALEFSEAYYGIAYPLPKLDLLAIPDFAFGAMENWGAITFRENLLLYYRRMTSKSGLQRIAEVIAHEIAHQWFGNLVTPLDWQYLWLNESFATYFGYGVVDHYYPQWDLWEQFLHGMTASALFRDGLRETIAIEIPGGEHVVINTSTAPIIYNKGGSILRQIEGHIGRDNFRKGLRHYLKKHEYGVATSQDLWESFESASAQPVRAMMKSWVEQPGYPIVTARRKGCELRLQQERFTYLPNRSEQQWMIPITIRLFFEKGKSQLLTVLMEDSQKIITIPANTVAYKLNDGQSGFYRVDYRDELNLEILGRFINTATLAPEDRWGVQNDLFAQVEKGDVSVEAYLQFLTNYDRESAYLPLAGIVSNLSRLYLAADAGGREKIRSLAQPRYEAILQSIGYEPRQAEAGTFSILREQLVWESALMGSAKATAFGCERFAGLQKGVSVDSDLMRCVLQVGALCGDQAVWDWLDQRFRHSAVEHERINILAALGSFKDKSLLKNTLGYILDAVPPRNKSLPGAAMAANPHAAPMLWDWYVSNLAEIEKFHPLIYERVIAAIVPATDIQRAEEVKAFCADYMRKTDLARDVIRLSLEKLEINLRLRHAVQL